MFIIKDDKVSITVVVYYEVVADLRMHRILKQSDPYFIYIEMIQTDLLFYLGDVFFLWQTFCRRSLSPRRSCSSTSGPEWVSWFWNEQHFWLKLSFSCSFWMSTTIFCHHWAFFLILSEAIEERNVHLWIWCWNKSSVFRESGTWGAMRWINRLMVVRKVQEREEHFG